MLLFRLIFWFELVAGQWLALFVPAAGQEDPYVAVQTHVPGAFAYVKRTEIEALSDVSPSHCVLILSPGVSFQPRRDVRAFEKCASVLDRLRSNSFASFPSDFGNVYILPQGVISLAWTSNSRCRISLGSGKFVYAKTTCNKVHKTLHGE